MTAQGWPFLVARGHQRGYTVLLAPGFLLDTNDYGFLEEAAGPVRDTEPPRILATASPLGHQVCLVWSEYAVTEADLVPHTRDEHSRPLRLINGFVCTEGTVASASAADLAVARTAALDTYRRFLADEHHFTVEPATPFPLSSPITAAPRRAAAPTPTSPKPRPRFVIPLAAAAVVVTATTAVIALASTASQQPSPTCIPVTSTPSIPPSASIRPPTPTAPTTPPTSTTPPCP